MTAAQPIAYLEGYHASSGRMARLAIMSLPCRIGRRAELELQLQDPRISQLHAEIFLDGSDLRIRDLASTNGTFVNGAPVTDPLNLQEGDLVRLASLEFRFTRESQRPASDPLNQTVVMAVDETPLALFSQREFLQLMRDEAVVPYFQPIVRLADEELVGYEVLGRGRFEGMPTSPRELFQIARTFGMETTLSELFRETGVRSAADFAENKLIFINMHPAETHGSQLQQSLSGLRAQFPKVAMVLEIHEAAITDIEQIRHWRDLLRDLSIGLAYDDFGAGQARLNELAEVPPDYLKFDVSLIRDIHHAPAAKQQLLETLLKIAKDLGVRTLAEGVELPQERDACRHIGFDLAQGFMFGRPEPHE